MLISCYSSSDTAYEYAYDDNGNITSITRGTVSVTYEYNGANELIRENNAFTNQTVTYTYDSWGNLTEKNVYAYTTATNPGTPTSTIPYVYSTGEWKDQLISYGNQTISYDTMGNPTTYRGKTLTWRGKQLTGIADGTDTIAYSYDENGLRLQKTVNNVATDYYYNGSVLIGLVKDNDTLRFSYDAAGLVQAVNHNGTYYYYLRNGQGDIVKLIDGSGATVVEYTYDSWGKPLSCTGTLATTLGVLNPFRYRGYVYDEETGFYYLKSRYYDPETCRFISADVLLSTGQGVIGHNCFAYCNNNPVNACDSEGVFPFLAVTAIIGAVVGAVAGGIIAAANGGDTADIIAGAAIGAAAGGLLGLGAGAAASSVVSGSLLATSADIAANLSLIPPAVSSSGAVVVSSVSETTVTAVAAAIEVSIGCIGTASVITNPNIMYSKRSNDPFGNRQKKGTPRNNTAQNKQFNSAMKKAGIENKSVIRQIHDSISHMNYSFEELVDYARSFIE